MTDIDKPGVQFATLGGGCFWCVEAAFAALHGVVRVVSGYAGGGGANPTYREVCGGQSGFAEVVQITFDPAEITYEDLLEVFFAIHDPTTLNRQGNDVGTQYRSVIFFHSPQQQAAAQARIAALKKQGIPIVTEVLPCPEFFRAEDYHHDYYTRNSDQPYCRAIISPKLEKLRKLFAPHLKHPSGNI